MWTKNKILTPILLLSILVSGWIWGVVSHRNYFFPYTLVRSIYKEIKSEDETEKLHPETNRNFDKQEFVQDQIHHAKRIYKFVENNPSSLRDQFKERILLPKNMINITEVERKYLTENVFFSKLDNIGKHYLPDNTKIFMATYYGINHFGVLEKEVNNIQTGDSTKRRLLVYHQGHRGNPYNSDNFLSLKKIFKNSGYDVLSLSMSGVGFNEGEVWFPVSVTKSEANTKTSFNYSFNKIQASIHDYYSYFYDERLPNILPIALMLSGNYQIIKHIIKQYDEIIMIGISGGGWYTTILSALISDIKKSYSFDGSFPKAYAIATGNFEWEYVFAPIWNDVDFWQFYFLTLFNDRGQQLRNHYLVYNAGVRGWGDPQAQSFIDLVSNLSISGLEAFKLKNHEHEIDISFVNNFILQ